MEESKFWFILLIVNVFFLYVHLFSFDGEGVIVFGFSCNLFGALMSVFLLTTNHFTRRIEEIEAKRQKA